MGENQAGQLGNSNFEAVTLSLLIRPGKQQQRYSGRGLPIAFHRCNFGRLVFQRVDAMKVAYHRLGRGHDQNQPQANGQRLAVNLHLTPTQQIPGAYPRDHKSTGQERSQAHMRKAVREGRIKDCFRPGGNEKYAIAQLHTGRRMHPAIGGENPERRNEGAQCDHTGREQMHSLRDPIASEQQHPEERRLQEKRSDHLVAENRPEKVGRRIGIVAPVGTELEGHDDTRHHPHAKHHREHLHPESGQALPYRIPGFEEEYFQKGNKGRQTDGKYRKDRVKRHHKRKLDARQQERVQFHEQSSLMEIVYAACAVYR